MAKPMLLSLATFAVLWTVTSSVPVLPYSSPKAAYAQRSAVGVSSPEVQVYLTYMQMLSSGVDPSTASATEFHAQVADSLMAAAPGGQVIDDGTEVSRNYGILPFVYESDIILTQPQAEEILNRIQVAKGLPPSDPVPRKGRTKRKIELAKRTNRWSTTINYGFQDSDSAWQKAIEEGIDLWRSSTCLRFQRGDGDRLFFKKEGGCTSWIGKQGGSQNVNIGPGCDSAAIVAHEVGHALGFWHEQSRPDRDQFVNVLTNNIITTMTHNFAKESSDKVMTEPSYDYGSVMHYGPGGFAKVAGTDTLATKDPTFASTIGQRGGLSFHDIKAVNLAYCGKTCEGQAKPTCYNGGYPDPKNCGACRCPGGLSGDCRQAERTAFCGDTLTGTTEWQTITSSRDNARCVWLLKAPKGGKILVEFTKINYRKYYVGSCSPHVEWKFKADLGPTGARFCDSEKMPKAQWSEGDVAIVIHDTTYFNLPGSFVARFRTNAEPVTATTEPVIQTRVITDPRLLQDCTKTISGRSCQEWRLQTKFKGEGALCSDPANEGYTWCFTTDPKARWEQCEESCGPKAHEPKCYVKRAEVCYANGYVRTTLGSTEQCKLSYQNLHPNLSGKAVFSGTCCSG